MIDVSGSFGQLAFQRGGGGRAHHAGLTNWAPSLERAWGFSACRSTVLCKCRLSSCLFSCFCCCKATPQTQASPASPLQSGSVLQHLRRLFQAQSGKVDGLGAERGICAAASGVRASASAGRNAFPSQVFPLAPSQPSKPFTFRLSTSKSSSLASSSEWQL